MGYLLAEADIRWQAGAPVSGAYGDIYWQAGQALAEKSHVFLAPLQRLVAAAPAREGLQVTVGELGFGFGVNCLLAAAWWRRALPRDALLHYVAVEGHPVSLKDLRRFHAEAGLPLREELLNAWPGACEGQHPLWLADNVRLLLVHREATQALAQLDASADAWFLDGFSPARNEAMWTERLFRLLFARSRPGALIASYSVAGEVQKRLAAAGFVPALQPGYGRKRQMLAGRRRGEWRPFYRSKPRALILGAGLAGRFCAEALGRRGLAAPLVGGLAGNPSNVPQLAVFPQLAARAEERHRFSLAASLYMLTAPGMRQTGLSRIAKTPAEAARFQRIAAQFPCGMIEWQGDRLHFHQAGWWSLADFAAPSELREGRAIRIAQEGAGWRCQLADGSALAADALLLATGHDASLVDAPLGLRPAPGQAISVPGIPVPRVTTGPVSVFPPRAGRSTISGTYGPRGRSAKASAADTKALLAAAARLAPAGAWQEGQPEVHTGIRASTRDRLPMVGALSALATGQGGLYVCNGFGSHGATHARLCAEHLASLLLGEPSPLGRAQQRLLAPERFALRDGLLSPQSAAP